MRFAVFSDLHGNLAATQAVIQAIDAVEDLDFTVCLGNVVGHGPHPNEVIDLLHEHDVNVIRGNYDEFVLGRRAISGADFASTEMEQADRAVADWTRQQLTPESRAYLEKLPRDSRTDVTLGGVRTTQFQPSERGTDKARKNFLGTALLGTYVMNMGRPPKRLRPRRLLFVHGSPRDVTENLYPETGQSILQAIASNADADVILHGHTHEPYHREIVSTAFICPGIAGWPVVAGRAEFAVVNCESEIEVDFRSAEFDAEREASDANRLGLPDPIVNVLRSGLGVPSPV